MADNVWIGTDGNWSTTGNWSLGVIPGAASSKTDTVIIPDGAAAITTNLDRSGDDTGAGLNIGYLFISKKMTNDIGSSGTPLQCTCDKLRHEGTGTLYFTSNTGSDADTTDLIEIKSNNLINAAVLDDTTTAQLIELVFIKGGIQVNAAVNAMPEVNIMYDKDPFRDVNVTFTSAATITELFATGGNITINTTAVTTTTMCGGTITRGGTTGGGIIRQCGGTYIWNVLKVDGSLSTLYLLGGTFDTTRTAGVKEILDLTLFPSGNLIPNTDLHLGGTPGIPLGQ